MERDVTDVGPGDQQVYLATVTWLLTMAAREHPDYVPEEGATRILGKAGFKGRAGELRWTLSLEWETNG
jgi:hypothetical protein